MRVYLGSDHAGFELKDHLLGRLERRGDEPVDCGPVHFDPDDDYPPFVLRAAQRAAAEPGSFAVVIGGSGNGEAMAANKVAGVRAALVWNAETATLAREHNDANVIALGARLHTPDEAARLLALFLDTSFGGGARHARRIAMITAYESGHELPPLPGASPRDAHPELPEPR